MCATPFSTVVISRNILTFQDIAGIIHTCGILSYFVNEVVLVEKIQVETRYLYR